MSYYNTGTASVGAGSTTVTGVGTSWLSNAVQAGDIFRANGLSVRIAAVNSNTSLTLAIGWPGTALSGANYDVGYTPAAGRIGAAFNNLAALLGSGGLQAIAGLTSAADRLPYFTGAGTAALAVFTSTGRAIVAAASAAAARTALELGTMATQASNLVSISGGALSGLTGVGWASTFGDKFSLYGNRLDFANNNGGGVESTGMYLKCGLLRIYLGVNADNGVSDSFELTTSGLAHAGALSPGNVPGTVANLGMTTYGAVGTTVQAKTASATPPTPGTTTSAGSALLNIVSGASMGLTGTWLCVGALTAGTSNGEWKRTA